MLHRRSAVLIEIYLVVSLKSAEERALMFLCYFCYCYFNLSRVYLAVATSIYFGASTLIVSDVLLLIVG
jgi:hypothetical protein